ncbi:hypothetical protein Vadar_031482 [Vaccinium darrowii]|uniref:Uncharacterized protein n=1 Tax=Vaccinium darrowii TaxID=229202 RepID=A0ACB7XMK1_9ERIC|nr:hypothetical protein Vadar_031482 [Vaccinium darrowii]
MFAIHKGRVTISIYVQNIEINVDDDLVNLSSDIDKSANSESENEGDPNSPRGGSICSSDLEYFTDGDELYDSGYNITIDLESDAGLFSLKVASWNARGSGSGEGPSNVLLDHIQEVENDNELNTPTNSSDEEGNVEFTEFFGDRDMERPHLEKGMLFANAIVFRTALRKHAIQIGREFRFLKNEGDKVTTICKNGYGWRVHAGVGKI